MNYHVKVRLPSGNLAVYLISERLRTLMRDRLSGACNAEIVRNLGIQVVHEKDGQWYWPCGWKLMTDDLNQAAYFEALPFDTPTIAQRPK